MISYTEFKDKDGTPLVITVEYDKHSWMDSIEVDIFVQKEVKYFIFWTKNKLVKVMQDIYSVSLDKDIDCDFIKTYATRTLEDYNNSLIYDEKRDKLKSMFNRNECK